MNARPEQVTVTDPAHPLHGRVFVLVSLPSASGPGSYAEVAYRGDSLVAANLNNMLFFRKGHDDFDSAISMEV